MAFPSSSLGGKAFQDLMNATQTPINLTLTTYKTALFQNANTANPKTDTTYNAGGSEASGAGYSAGGIVVASPAVSDAGGASDSIFKYTLTSPSWAAASITARGMILYIPAAYPLCFVNFGSDFTSTAGTFTVTIAAGGLFQIDLTP